MVYRQLRAKPSDTPPGSQLSRICNPRHSIYNTVLSGFQASLSAQPTLLGESSSRFNQSGSKASQACDGHPRCNLNLVLLFRYSLPLPAFGRLLLFLTHAAINLHPPSHTVLYRTLGSSAEVLQFPVMPNRRPSTATQSVHYLYFHPSPRFPAFSSSPDMTLLDNVWSLTRSSALDHNNLLVRTVVSILSHSVRWRASLQERVRLFGDLHEAPRIQSNIHVAHSYRRASITSDLTIRAFRGRILALGRSYSSRV